MREGPKGFALAKFSGEAEFESEMPNIMLHDGALPARSAVSRVKKLKRPAAASAPREIVTDPTDDQTDPVPKLYKVMFYKKTGKAAIRQATGEKRQIMQFGGVTYHRDFLVNVARSTVEALTHKGLPEANCVTFAHNLLTKHR